MYRYLLAIFLVAILSACQSLSKQDDSLYLSLGGSEGITKIIDIFIYEIGQTEEAVNHFEDTDLDRFREKAIEHVCMLTGGPCEYTGEEMQPAHQGMNISESEFNEITTAMIYALNTAGVSIGDRNRLLAIMAAMREEIIYQ
jgi:hemoglobin